MVPEDVWHCIAAHIPLSDLPFFALSCRLFLKISLRTITHRLSSDSDNCPQVQGRSRIPDFPDVCLTSVQRWIWASERRMRLPAWLEDSHLKELYPYRDRLLYLDLRRCEAITDAAVGPLLQNAPLQHLNLRSCTRVTPKVIPYLTERPVRTLKTDAMLQYINFSKMAGLKDEDLIHLLPYVGCSLTHLDLSHCEFLTDGALVALAEANPPLKVLRLSWNELVTDDGVMALCEARMPLQILDLNVNENLTDATLETIAKSSRVVISNIDIVNVGDKSNTSEEREESPYGKNKILTPTNCRRAHCSCATPLYNEEELSAQRGAGLQLDALSFKWNNRFTDRGLSCLAFAPSLLLKRIRKIDFSSNERISDEGVRVMCEDGLPSLVELKLGSGIGDTSIQYVCKAAANLSLFSSWSSRISNLSIRYMIQSKVPLRHVILPCSSVTKEAAASLTSSRQPLLVKIEL